MPSRPLTLQRIVKAAVRIADREGLDALSMRRLAAEVGAGAMSLYHHVPGKAALFDALQSFLIREADLPTDPYDWEAWVRNSALRFREVAVRHPGCIEVFARKGIAAPEALAPFEAALGAFARGGFDRDVAYRSLQTVVAVVIGLGLLEASEQRALTPDTTEINLSPEEFPLLSAVATESMEPDTLWQFVIDTLVIGIASQVP